MDMRPVDRLVSAALLGRLADVRMMVADDPALLSARNVFGAGAIHPAHYGEQGAVLGALKDLALSSMASSRPNSGTCSSSAGPCPPAPNSRSLRTSAAPPHCTAR